jgi:hypothetical protein
MERPYKIRNAATGEKIYVQPDRIPPSNAGGTCHVHGDAVNLTPDEFERLKQLAEVPAPDDLR